MSITETRPRAELLATPTHAAPGGANDYRQAIVEATPSAQAPVGTNSRPTNGSSPPTLEASGGPNDSRQAIRGASPELATPAGADSRPTNDVALPGGRASGGVEHADRQVIHEAHSWDAVGADVAPDPATNVVVAPMGTSLLDPALALAADVLDDIERVRIANQNRLRQLTRSAVDSDGEERGFGLDESHPDVARLAAMVATLEKLEHDATLQLQRQMRRHPLGPWAKGVKGVGEKQVARLLAVLGDPYWNTATDSRRTVSALWAYCGLHVIPAEQCSVGAQRSAIGGDGGDPGHRVRDDQRAIAGVAPKRARGAKANWSTKAKTRAYLIAESCIKQAASPYRAVYEAARAKYADAVHAVDCVRCGPSGKPAVAGSPLSLGHQHARAMRAVSKELLKDLWREARRIHTGGAA